VSGLFGSGSEHMALELGITEAGTNGGVPVLQEFSPFIPCFGKTGDALDYNRRRQYGRGKRAVNETGEEHIKRRHINFQSGASQYWIAGHMGTQDEAFKQVRELNKQTFNRPDRREAYYDGNDKLVGFVFIKKLPSDNRN
jgi:hypothetical protein